MDRRRLARDRWRVFAQGATQVLLVSANSVTLASFQATGELWRLVVAGAIGFAISAVWWQNTRAASLSAIDGGRVYYAAGAALGTMLGAALAYGALR